jgi:ABC-type amino acid transport substrate-binding protein
MKRLKFAYILLALVLCFGVLGSCAKKAEPAPDFNGDGVPYNSMEDFKGKTIVTLSVPGFEEAVAKGMEEIGAPDTSFEFIPQIYVDTISDIISTLTSGRGDLAMVFTPTARYYASINDALGCTEMLVDPTMPEGSLTTSFNVSMITRESDTELLNQLNDAIIALKEDGTLDKLLEDYVEALNVAATDAIPVIDGAPTIKVGISGDAPPFDYINPSGEPAGFNVELMKAIAARCGINIEFVTINTNAKLAALDSNRIDVHFYNSDMPNEMREGYAHTENYCGNVTISYLYLK